MLKQPIATVVLKDGKTYDVVPAGSTGPAETSIAIFHESHKAEVMELISSVADIASRVT